MTRMLINGQLAKIHHSSSMVFVYSVVAVNSDRNNYCANSLEGLVIEQWEEQMKR